MVNSCQDWGCRFIVAACAIGGAIAFSANRALPQVVPDGTLGANPSTVTPNVIKGLPSTQIDGGAISGKNLFHSFSEFNVADRQGVYFTNPAGIVNILGRVTGNNPSNIQGTLGVLGNANLFLMNPNGIIFGQNARLDISGSFVGTTANAIWFPGGGEFSRTSPVDPNNSVLAVNPSALFFNQTPAGAIDNQSTVGLQVPEGQNLFLVGGNVTLNGGVLRAPGGRIELGGLAGAGEVKIEDVTNGSNPDLKFPNVRLSFPDGVTRADVLVTNGSVVDVTAGGGGDIAIRARNINVSESSSILAGIASGRGSSSARAGNIALNATGKVSVTQRSRIANDVNANATSDSSNIFEAIKNNIIYGSVGIKAESFELMSGAQISTSTYGNGSAGLLLVQTEGEVLVDGEYVVDRSAAIFSNVEGGGVGDAGGILIEAGSLSLVNGGQLQTLVRGADQALVAGWGSAGAVLVEARDTVTISGRNSQGLPSAIFSSLQPGAMGNAGLVGISAGSVNLTNGALVSTSTLGNGSAGIVLIEAKGDVSLTGSGTLITSNVEQGATGNTVGVRIDARSLFMSGGSNIQALTRGNGSAGAIVINASDVVDLRGVSPEGPSTGLFTSTEGNATGEGGLIRINAGTLRLSDAAVLSARTQTAASGGGILIDVNTLELLNGGQILATAYSSGSSGAIIINANDKIILSGRDPTYISRIFQIYENYVAQFGVDEAIKLTIQTFDNVPPGSSGIFANVLSGSTGAAGGILIKTKDLFIGDGGTISVDNPGPREAGDIIILARDLIMKNQATINARATSGQGGNILLFPDTFLLLLQNSRISTTSGFNGQPGNGGNVFIDNRYTIAAPFDDNNINANAFTGTGGNIRIIADRLYDIAKRSLDDPGSNDITASSDFGLDGTVRTPPLVADPTQGLVNLPADLVDPSTLMAETCAPRGSIGERQKNQFIVTGRGGLPPDPNAAFPGEAVVNDLGTPEQAGTNSTDVPNSTNPANPIPTATTSPQQPEIVEAQGWVYGKDGDIIFTAQAPTVTPNSPVLTPASTCNAVSTLPH
jgi:filamentous hemagglutinin family protein